MQRRYGAQLALHSTKHRGKEAHDLDFSFTFNPNLDSNDRLRIHEMYEKVKGSRTSTRITTQTAFNQRTQHGEASRSN